MSKNRFAQRKSWDFFWLKDIVFPVALVLACVVLVSFGMEALNTRSEAERLESAKKAVTRAAVQCYALEGRYPLQVSYLEENYGLSVDTGKYIVHYQAFASNIMPDIDVIPLNFSSVDNEAEWDDDWILDDWEPDLS